MTIAVVSKLVKYLWAPSLAPIHEGRTSSNPATGLQLFEVGSHSLLVAGGAPFFSLPPWP